MATEGVALRKRQQIAKANRMMFLWVAGVSVIVGIAAVASLFLVQKALFNERVLGEKDKTVKTLKKNNQAVDELQSQIQVLNTNDSLKGNMVPGDDAQPVQAVLDALPSTANSAAFGASLQQRFLQGDGIELNALSVDPVQDVEATSSRSSRSSSSNNKDTAHKINFSFAVSTTSNNPDALKSHKSLSDILLK